MVLVNDLQKLFELIISGRRFNSGRNFRLQRSFLWTLFIETLKGYWQINQQNYRRRARKISFIEHRLKV